MKISTVLFDLDGTLTDSGPGIISGVKYALKKYNMEVQDDSQLRCFIGPPLKQQFRLFCNISEEESERAVAYYREYYTDKGIFENAVYDGILNLLSRLKEAGIQLAVATSKPEHFAQIIAEHFNIAQYFDFIGGSQMDGTRTDKEEVIEYVLQSCKIRDRSGVLMIGDRNYDIIGAKNAGIKAMGVLFGYGSLEELEQAGADYIVKTPKEAAEMIVG